MPQSELRVGNLHVELMAAASVATPALPPSVATMLRSMKLMMCASISNDEPWAAVKPEAVGALLSFELPRHALSRCAHLICLEKIFS